MPGLMPGVGVRVSGEEEGIRPRVAECRCSIGGQGGVATQAEQTVQGLAVLGLADRVGAVVGAPLNQQKGLGLGRSLVQPLPQRGWNQPVFAAVHHQQGRADARDPFDGLEALGDQGTHRQPAPTKMAHHVGNRGECAFDQGAGFVLRHRPGGAGA
ncbi:hypothetical protein RZS08_50265, partial [Arthrospira platensis SPKY1]|nr:hypothetical protein [Arthrospira platensis SPKY1]